MALTQEEMEQMPKPIEQAFSDLELKILEDIVARIKENNMITGTAEYDIFQLVKMGESEKMIKRYVEKTLKLTYSEIEDIFGDVFERGYNRDSNLYKAVGADFVAYKDNKQLQQFIGAIKDQTKGTYKNITNTMGFVRQREGVKTWVPLTKYYKDALSRAVFEITSGAFSYSQVIKRTINEMTNSGIRTIDYASGRTSRIEVAARRAIMTAVTQVTAKVTEQNMDKLHTDYVEVSWHETARPTHQVWQGRVFKWNRGNEVNAVSDKAQNEEQLLRNDPEYQEGGKLINGDWKYDINTKYSANAKIEAAKISKYAIESPYEAFAEGFLAKEKGQKIPENIEKVIEEAKVKAGVKKTVRHHEKGYIGNNAQRIGSNSINLDYINSEAYANKFKKISKDNELNNLIYNKSIELLRNNNNSDTEGLCIITVPNKQVLLNVRGERDALGVELSKKQSSIVKNCKMEMVGIHNHPTNLLPNGSDFTAAGYRGYKYGIVVTHDGRIYKYSVGNRPFLPALLDSRIDKYCAKEYNLNTREAYEKALNEFRKEYGISWQEIE
jgi:hypothetical protein